MDKKYALSIELVRICGTQPFQARARLVRTILQQYTVLSTLPQSAPNNNSHTHLATMGAESLNCTAVRKSARNNNNRTSNSSLSSDNGLKTKGAGQLPVTTRGGLRVYKVVILGDGGVGKSGENEPGFVGLYILYFILCLTLYEMRHAVMTTLHHTHS